MKRLLSLPIRWRLALTSAGLTFAILLTFAVVIGMFTANRLSSDFDNDLRLSAADLEQRIPVGSTALGSPLLDRSDPQLVNAIVDAAATGDAAVRVVAVNGQVLAGPPDAPDLGPPVTGVRDSEGYRVVSQPIVAQSMTTLTPVGYLQYGKRTGGLKATIGRVKLFLALGVLGGTALALLAGLAVARRAMRPVADLTSATKEVARTRDPGVELPRPRAEDEVADLGRTLEEMLKALDAARRETEATLEREREFVADASHELRTPLTSVLANLELLEEDLRGEDAEIAGSALRSTRRMRRLVADLLFLARADTGRPSAVQPVDLGAVVREAAAETAPLATGHLISVHAPAGIVVMGSADDLHRLTLNLLQNAVAHTPSGTAVTASVERSDDGQGTLAVSDDGPGVSPDVRERLFERFVRGAGDAAGGGRGSGLGLSIVQAVAEAHGGGVSLEETGGAGARFVVCLPAAPASAEAAAASGRVRSERGVA